MDYLSKGLCYSNKRVYSHIYIYIYIYVCVYVCIYYVYDCVIVFSIYDGSLGSKESDADAVLRWVSLIAMEDNIEHVSEQMLERLLQDHKVNYN